MAPSAALDLYPYWQDRRNRGFGDVQRMSDQVRQRFSVAGQEAADNLLVKALRAIETADHARAARYIQRAVDLPFDEHEQAYPALISAHMALFIVVTDMLDECPEGDATWLDAASTCSVRQQSRRGSSSGTSWRPSTRTICSRTLSAVGCGLPSRVSPHVPDTWDLLLPPEQQRQFVTEVLTACTAYERALAQRVGE